MKPSSPALWVALLSCLWTCSLAGVKELRLPVPTSETIALVAREMGATTFEESVEEADSVGAESGRRVQRKLVTGIQDIDDNTEYQEYQGVMGRPGVDFPVLPNIPSTTFSCRALRKPGYYADLDTDCQVFHICDGGRKISFLCPNGTIFRQSHLICDWWFRVDCGKSVELYDESAEQLAADQRVYKARADAITRAMAKGLETKDLKTEQSSRYFNPSPQVQRDTNKQGDQRSKVTGPKINEAAFASAKENYENRQSSRKSTASNSNRKENPTTEKLPRSSSFENEEQFQYKPSDEFGLNTGTEEKEQQILSETASFARSNSNRYRKQFYQEDSPKPQSNINPNSVTPENPGSVDLFRQKSTTKSVQNSDFPSTTEFSTASVRSTRPSSFISANTVNISFPTTPTPPQRNFRPSGRLLPTSSQNNNLRPNFSRNKLIKTVRKQNLQSTRSTQQPSTQIIDVNANILQSFPSAQNSFARPSPDLMPPESNSNNLEYNIPPSQLQTNDSSPKQDPIPSNNENIQSSKNKLPVSSTRLPSSTFQANRFSLPSTQSPFSDYEPQRRVKQRRFTSTTQKPVFTVKFRPSKSFSYVELERTGTSTQTPTPSDNPYSQETSASELESSNSVNLTATVQPSLISTSTIYRNTGTSQPSPKVKLAEGKSKFTKESFRRQNERISESVPNRASDTYTSSIGLSSFTPTPSYSPTIPTQTTPTIGSRSIQQPNLPAPFASVDNDNMRLDKIATFGNIDPAEINLLPSNQKEENIHNVRVPDSSGPNALHTLALYYATSESDSVTSPTYDQDDTLTTEPEEDLESLLGSHSGSPVEDFTFDIVKINRQPKQEKNKISDEILLRSHSGSPDDEAEIDNANRTDDSIHTINDLPSVLTKATKDSYAFLFNDTSDSEEHADGKPCDGEDVFDLDKTTEKEPEVSTYVTEKEIDVNDDVKNDLDIEQSRGIVQPNEESVTKQPLLNIAQSLDSLPDELKLRDSTDLRELAQVFSRALSAYLEDPDSFRRILSEVRPTEPTNNAYSTTLSLEENDDEVLDFSDASDSERLGSNNPISDFDDKAPVDQGDIVKINDLVQVNNISKPSNELPYFPTYEKSEESQIFTTVNPTSLAEDTNLLVQESNHSVADTLTEDTYSNILRVTEQSMPKYGGFYNNSGASEYKAYGSEVPGEITGKPLTDIPLPTDNPIPVAELETETTTDVGVEILKSANSQNIPSASNHIELESIPEQLGIGHAHDINSLIDNHKGCNDSSHSHESAFENHFLESNIGNKEGNFREDELYDKGEDQEKVLVASGSQSFLSRDNYVRFIGAKEEHNTKFNSNKAEIITKAVDTTTTKTSTTVKGRGTVKYDSPLKFDAIDQEQINVRRRPQKELAFQNVNLGNGVTLERTKTLHHSTPSIKNSNVNPTVSPVINDDININPLAINAQLGFISEELATSIPLQNMRSTVNFIRATTYHPPQKSEIPDSIPPRGFLKDSWKWNSGPSNNLESSSTSVNDQPSSLRSQQLDLPDDETKQPIIPSFETFASTLLPPNMTLETAKEEILEKKAEEIFGKLNKTSADMLMNVMNQAESNMTVRRLVLLLVADRNGRNNKSHEESRSQLIQALLKTSESMPAAESVREETSKEENKVSTKKASRSRGRSKATSNLLTTTPSSTTQIRGRGAKYYRGTESDTAVITNTVNAQKRMDAQHLRSPNLFPQDPAIGLSWDPDARAVELLKSLYNIAARWG